MTASTFPVEDDEPGGETLRSSYYDLRIMLIVLNIGSREGWRRRASKLYQQSFLEVIFAAEFNDVNLAKRLFDARGLREVEVCANKSCRKVDYWIQRILIWNGQ